MWNRQICSAILGSKCSVCGDPNIGQSPQIYQLTMRRWSIPNSFSHSIISIHPFWNMWIAHNSNKYKCAEIKMNHLMATKWVILFGGILIMELQNSLKYRPPPPPPCNLYRCTAVKCSMRGTTDGQVNQIKTQSPNSPKKNLILLDHNQSNVQKMIKLPVNKESTETQDFCSPALWFVWSKCRDISYTFWFTIAFERK